MRRVLIATSNSGKLHDFAGAAKAHGISIASLPNFSDLPGVIEDGDTFEANARKKAEHYSRFAAGELVLADDSGLEVNALGGAPGVISARYAAENGENSSDAVNNAKLLRELSQVAGTKRLARFVCVIAAACDGITRASFRGEAEGSILFEPKGTSGFGYDPLFLIPDLQKTFAELAPEEKAQVSHRGKAFKKFLEWAKNISTTPETDY
jgi:XTP/dITP diphosphohydrolase